MEEKPGMELNEAQLEQAAGGGKDMFNNSYMLCNWCGHRIYVRTRAGTARCLCPNATS